MRAVVHETGVALRHCLAESRPVVQLIFLMRFCAGALLGMPHAVGPRAPAGTLGWAAAVFAVYLYNGITDRIEDRRNGSARPIARGTLSARSAALAVAAAAVVALAAGAAVGPGCLALTALFLAAGYVYSGPPLALKRSFYAAGLVGAAGGFLTYCDGALVWGGRLDPTLLLFATMLSLWMGAVGGVAKDLPDVPGDRLAGRRTLPVMLSETRVRLIVSAEAGILAGAFGVCAARVPVLRASAAALALGAVAVVLATALLRADADRSRRRSPYRAFMTSQYLSHAALVGSIVIARRAWLGG